MAAISGIYWGISCFFAVKFFAIGVYVPFLPLVLAGRGLQPSEIAIVMAASPALRIATTPFLGMLSDRFRHRKHAALLYSCIATLLIVPLLWVDGFVSILVVTSLSAVFWMAVLPVADALTVVAAKQGNMQYGRMRLWGSLAYIAANFLAGWLLDLSGPQVLVVLIVSATAAATLASLALPRDAEGIGSRETHSYWSLPALRTMRSVPKAAIALLAAALGQAAHAMVYAFGTIHWTRLGLSGYEVGAAWGIGVVAEVLLFAGAGWIRGARAPEILILVGLTAGLVRWGLAPFAADLPGVLSLQLLHGITFGATHLGAMRVIADRLPDAHAGGVMGLYAAACGLAMSGAFALSGPIFERFGGYGFWAMASLCLVAALSIVAVLRRGSGGPA